MKISCLFKKKISLVADLRQVIVPGDKWIHHLNGLTKQLIKAYILHLIP